jgi:hypothetical protein
MSPFLLEEVAREHIADLHAAGAAARLAGGHGGRRKGSLRRAIGMRLVDAGLVLIDGRPAPSVPAVGPRSAAPADPCG